MGASPRWGVCTTVRAPVPQVLAFVAHHLSVGAHRVWVHFDDPEDPAARALEGMARVTAIRCDDAYWQRLCGRRPPTHQLRQFRNVTRVYRRVRMEFVAHFDVDEYLTGPDGDIANRVAQALAGLPADRHVLRIEPAEALFSPGLADDIFTARYFRRALPAEDQAAQKRILGPDGAFLPRGMLSHTVGKCFFRTGIEGMKPNIHGARIDGVRVFGGDFHPDLRLLHFHAESPERWQRGLPFRLSRGAYQFLPALQAHLLAMDGDGHGAFYRAVQTASPDMIARLSEAGLLVEADLRLRDKVARLLAGDIAPPQHG